MRLSRLSFNGAKIIATGCWRRRLIGLCRPHASNFIFLSSSSDSLSDCDSRLALVAVAAGAAVDIPANLLPLSAAATANVLLLCALN